MRYLRVIPVLLVVILAGCKVIPNRDSDPIPVLGLKTEAPTGPDGLSIQDKRDLDKLRTEMALRMTKELNQQQEIEIRGKHHPLRRPTITVKYTGKPPQGVFKDMDEQLAAYQSSYITGDTVVYDTDLAKMTMIMERRKDGEAYDYRELTSTVPYGLCLDFITENLGKESKGYIMRKIECTQEGLGVDF